MLSVRISVAFITFALVGCNAGAERTGEDADRPIDGSTSDAAFDASSGSDASSDGSIATDSSVPACELYAQAGCEPSERCGLAQDRSVACIAVGVKAPFEDCDPNAAVDECGRGYTCLRSPDSPGVPYQCTAFCTGTGRGSCGQWETCVAQQGVPARICTSYTQCRPVEQDCPPRSDGADDCYIVEGFAASCLAEVDTPVAIGDTCTVSNQCVVGSSCIRIAVGNDARRCMKHCNPAAPSCPAATVCTPLGPAGVCR